VLYKLGKLTAEWLVGQGKPQLVPAFNGYQVRNSCLVSGTAGALQLYVDVLQSQTSAINGGVAVSLLHSQVLSLMPWPQGKQQAYASIGRLTVVHC
jgi:hypothetical protein